MGAVGVACGLLEAERPRLVEEVVNVGSSGGATSGFVRGRSATEADDVAKVAALSQKLYDSLLFCFLLLGGMVSVGMGLEAGQLNTLASV